MFSVFRAFLFGPVVCAVAGAGTTAFADYNVVVGKDLTSTSEVEGRTLVGRRLRGSSSTYATRLNPSSLFANVDTLIVGDSIAAAGINVNAGNVRLGGTAGGHVNLNGVGGNLVEKDPSAAALVEEALLGVTAYSSYLKGLAATGSVANPAGSPVVTFTAVAGPGNLAVFQVDGSLFNDSDAQQYELVLGAGVNAATTFVFNVRGASATHNRGNFVGLFQSSALRPYMVWNFFDASTIKLNNQWFGAVLGPTANLTTLNAVEGSVWVGGNFVQKGEVRLPGYAGAVNPTATPEPATFGLTALAAACAILWRRRGRIR